MRNIRMVKNDKKTGIDNPLIDLFKYENKMLNLEFEKASRQGKGTPQEIADFRENYFNSFLSRYFPFPHRITKGQIIDSYNNKSCSIDSIVINPIHPYTIDTKEKFSLILADGVDLVIELKPDLRDDDYLFNGLKQIQSVKKLSRAKTPLLAPHYRYSDEIIKHSLKIPCFIFTLNVQKDISKFVNKIIKFYKKNDIPLEEQFDYLIINNIGVIKNIKFNNQIGGFEKKRGFIIEYSTHPLLHFLYLMNIVHHASIKIQHPILLNYFKNLGSYKMEHIWDDEIHK